MKTEYPLPAAPPTLQAPPAPKKSHAWIWTILAVLVVGGLIVAGAQDEDAEPNGPVGTIDQPAAIEPVEPSYEMTAEDVVDVMGSAKVQEFCGYYYQIGDYDAAYRAFKSGYGAETSGPSSTQIFDEMLSRC